jgi:tetratricopeptide (TPR) repeat protein
MAPDVLLDILADRVSATRAQGDWEASERCLSDVLLAARATGRVDREVDALLALASVRFWTDRAGCLRTAEEAHALADARGDPDTRTHARGYKAHLHLNLVGWDEEEAAACDRALLAARTDDDDSRLPFHLVRSVWLACLRSQYVTAESLAVEACVKARSAGDASEYLLALFWRAWAALHQGRWDDVLTCVEEGVRRSEEDAHRLWACLFTLMRAHLLLEVGHLPEAEEMVDAVLAVVDQDPNGIGQSGFLGRILRARIQVRSGRPEEASATLLALDAQISTPTSYLDTILELPLDLARAEVASALHRPADATSLATELLHRAQGPGERTYAGLAYALLATLHHTAGDHRAASHAIASALTLCDSPDGPCPLALLSLSRVPNAPPSLLDTATRLRASLAVTLRSAPELVQAWTDPTLPPSVAAPPAPSEQAS